MIYTRFIDLLEHIKENNYYVKNPEKTQSIVLLGNCHAAIILEYLDKLFKGKYKIFLIITWLFNKFKSDKDQEFYDTLKTEFKNMITKCDYLIYVKHYSDFHIDAHILHTYAKNKIMIPNILLNYSSLYSTAGLYEKELTIDELNKAFTLSKTRLMDSLTNLDFAEFNHIVQHFNVDGERFFDTPAHPVPYILYLLALQIYSLMINKTKAITYDDFWIFYYKHKTDKIFQNTVIPILGDTLEYTEIEKAYFRNKN